MGVADSVLVILYGLLFVFGIIGNTLIFIFFGFRMKALASYRQFIIHLAFADCVCSLVAPALYTYDIIAPTWNIGNISCKVLHVIPSVTITVSGWILCGIAYERYRAIIHPLKRRLTPFAIHVYCGMLWIVSSIVFSPHLIKLHVKDGKCRLTWASEVEALATTIVHFSIQNVIPLIIMSYFFHHMYRASREHSKLPVQALLITVLVFAICSIPQVVFYIVIMCLRLYQPAYSNHEQNVKIYTWLLVLLYANCVVNCFIYAGKFKQFRDFIAQCFGKKMQETHDTANETELLEISQILN